MAKLVKRHKKVVTEYDQRRPCIGCGFPTYRKRAIKTVICIDCHRKGVKP